MVCDLHYFLNNFQIALKHTSGCHDKTLRIHTWQHTAIVFVEKYQFQTDLLWSIQLRTSNLILIGVHNAYVHNWSLQSFNKDQSLVSHTTYVVQVNFRHKIRKLQFKVDSQQQFLRNFLYYLLSERASQKQYFFIFPCIKDI